MRHRVRKRALNTILLRGVLLCSRVSGSRQRVYSAEGEFSADGTGICTPLMITKRVGFVKADVCRMTYADDHAQKDERDRTSIKSQSLDQHHAHHSTGPDTVGNVRCRMVKLWSQDKPLTEL